MKQVRRLDQLLASLGHGSRREVDHWVKVGRVTVAGEAARRSDLKVDPAEVRVDGEPLEAPSGLLVMFHKPLGCVCSHNPAEGELVYDLLPDRWLRRNPPITTVGRLDKDTSGLLLLTDRGDWVHRWTAPKSEISKVYEVVVDRPLSAELVEVFAAGTLLLKSEVKSCLPARLDITGERTARLTLSEGRYHQVRRMFASQGWHVEQLHRSRFGLLTLGSLAPGEWRVFGGPEEVDGRQD